MKSYRVETVSHKDTSSACPFSRRTAKRSLPAVWLSEPTTLTFGDGLWFSFETVSTIGFGDIPAETPVARAITVVLSVISIFYIAMLTGVAVNYCNTLIKMRQKDTMARFMDDLEHLEELDRDELADLSRRVREYRRRQR